MTEQITSIWLVQGVHASDAAHQARVLSFDPIPRGTRPEDAIAEDMASLGRRPKVKSDKRRKITEEKERLSNVSEENALNEESEHDETEEELSDEDQEEGHTDETEYFSEEEDGDDLELSVVQMTNTCLLSSKDSVVSNKFAALDLLPENEDGE